MKTENIKSLFKNIKYYNSINNTKISVKHM